MAKNSPIVVTLCFSVVVGSIAVLVSGDSTRDFSPFYFISEPSDVIVEREGTAILNCSVFGNPTPTIEWKKDELFLRLDGDSRRTILADGSLKIEQVTHSKRDRPDEGVYQCVATIDNLGTIISRSAKLQIATLPRIEEEPQPVAVYLGETALFRCKLDAIPPANITWQKEKENLNNALGVDSRYTVLPSGSLEIHDIQAADEGYYRCRRSHIEGQKRSEEALLSILFGEALPAPPEFLSRPSSVQKRLGETVILECAANAKPVPVIEWRKDGQLILPSPADGPPAHFQVVGGSNLQISNLSEADAGTFTCTPRNSFGSVDATAELVVLVEPRFTEQPTNRYAYLHSDVTFRCRVYGVPFPSVRWFKNGDQLLNSEYFKIEGGGESLRILGLVSADEGLVQCLAANSAGNIQAQAQLIILDPADPIPTLPTPSNAASSTSQPASYRPTAASVGGGGGLAPSKPRDVVATTVSSRFVSLSWREPRETRGQVLAYSAYARKKESNRERVVNTTIPQVHEVTMRDLRPNSDYEFYIVAWNEHGAGEFSDVLSVLTQSELQVPGAVSTVQALPLSPSSIKVSWDLPRSSNGQITHYRLYYSPQPGPASGPDPPELYQDVPSLSWTLHDFLPYHTYSFRIVAYNENGAGVSSHEVSAQTFSDVPGAAPQNVTVEPFSSSVLVMGWLPPPPWQQNGEVTGYKIRWKRSASPLGGRRSRSNAAVVEAALFKYHIDGLERDTLYEARISAMTVNGTGPSTDWIQGKTHLNDLDESRVPPMSGPLFTRVLTTSIVVNWSPPADPGIMVRGYTVGYGPDVPDVHQARVAADTYSHTIKRLEPGTGYVISVRAYNNMGSGPPLMERVVTGTRTTKEPPPPLIPPLGLTVTVMSANTVNVQWADSSLRNQRVTDNRYYTVRFTTFYPANTKYKYINTTELQCIIYDLKPNTQYQFAVMVSKGGRSSPYSLETSAKTKDAAPGGAPKSLTPVPVENDPTAINLNWQPPKDPNGVIIGYRIYYTTDESHREWVIERVDGNRLTTVVKDLTPDTMYYFKIQAHNKMGVGPMSSSIHYRTSTATLHPGTGDKIVDGTNPGGAGVTEGPAGGGGQLMGGNFMWIIIACVTGLTVICIVVAVVIVCRKRNVVNNGGKKAGANGRGQYKMVPGKAVAAKPPMKDIKNPPDLWIHHEQVEMKSVKTEGPDTDMGMTVTPIPHNIDEPSGDDPRLMDTRRNSFLGDEDLDLSAAQRTLERRKPIVVTVPVDSQPQQPPPPVYSSLSNAKPPNGHPGGGSTSHPETAPTRPTYPRTQYSSALTNSSRPPPPPTTELRVRPRYALSAGQMTRSQSLDKSLGPEGYGSYTSDQTVTSDDGTKTLPSPGLRVTTTTSNPLSSFSVPGPPPNHSVSKQAQVSPFKKSGGLLNRTPSNNRSQPLPVNTPRAPEVTIRSVDNLDNTLPPPPPSGKAKSFSSDELNAEMANLEGLMKDLNAITASELDC